MTWCYCPHPWFAGNSLAPSQPSAAVGAAHIISLGAPAKAAAAGSCAHWTSRTADQSPPPSSAKGAPVPSCSLAPLPRWGQTVHGSLKQFAPLSTKQAAPACGKDVAFQGIWPQIISLLKARYGGIGDVGLSPEQQPQPLAWQGPTPPPKLDPLHPSGPALHPHTPLV